jgi:hypothetical protein
LMCSFNRYNCKLLLAVIDENHRGTYDFVYLPIDFKVCLLFLCSCEVWNLRRVSGHWHRQCIFFVQNKCNVGYAFINMTDPQHIIPFYKVYTPLTLRANSKSNFQFSNFLYLPTDQDILYTWTVNYCIVFCSVRIFMSYFYPSEDLLLSLTLSNWEYVDN